MSSSPASSTQKVCLCGKEWNKNCHLLSISNVFITELPSLAELAELFRDMTPQQRIDYTNTHFRKRPASDFHHLV